MLISWVFLEIGNHTYMEQLQDKFHRPGFNIFWPISYAVIFPDKYSTRINNSMSEIDYLHQHLLRTANNCHCILYDFRSMVIDFFHKEMKRAPAAMQMYRLVWWSIYGMAWHSEKHLCFFSREFEPQCCFIEQGPYGRL